MNDDELGRLLSDAFDAQAQASAEGSAAPPPPRFADEGPAGSGVPAAQQGPSDGATRRRTARWLAPVAAAAAVAAVVAGAVALTGSDGGGRQQRAASHPAVSHPWSVHGSGHSPTGSPSPQRSGSWAAVVRSRVQTAGGRTYGVGMPVIVQFSERFTDARALQDATTVTADGRPLDARWYFEPSSTKKGYPVEGHLRPRSYWPAHATIRVHVGSKGLPAGRSFGFVDDLDLEFRTGARRVVTVDSRSDHLTVQQDGRTTATYPVSLGTGATPTHRGTKVVMQQRPSACMTDAKHTYQECGIKWDTRLTDDGEYLLSAPWNVYNIKNGIDSSNGCTNLLPADAKQLYRTLRVGDVVTYPDAAGSPMTMSDGYGDWNVPWTTWRTGGLIPTS